MRPRRIAFVTVKERRVCAVLLVLACRAASMPFIVITWRICRKDFEIVYVLSRGRARCRD